LLIEGWTSWFRPEQSLPEGGLTRRSETSSAQSLGELIESCDEHTQHDVWIFVPLERLQVDECDRATINRKLGCGLSEKTRLTRPSSAEYNVVSLRDCSP